MKRALLYGIIAGSVGVIGYGGIRVLAWLYILLTVYVDSKIVTESFTIFIIFLVIGIMSSLLNDY